jgi:hypothetical protein
MAKIDRYNGNVRAFAADSLGTERTVFGATTQSDTLDGNITLDLLRGWGIVGVNENPTKQDFNGLAFTLGQLLAYLHQRGVPEWNADQEYYQGSVVTTLAGVYRLLNGGDGSVDPDTDAGANWELAPTRTEVDLLAPIDAPVFTGVPEADTAALGTSTKQIATTEFVSQALPDPNTQYAEITGGANANFTAMPQVGGDPIVESGSNADGEYTRWSDGTQIATVKNLALTQVANKTSGVGGTRFRTTWTYPIAFTSRPSFSITPDGGGGVSTPPGVDDTQIGGGRSPLANPASAIIDLYTIGTSGITASWAAEVNAVGRWD